MNFEDLKYKNHDWVYVRFPDGFETTAFIVGIAADLVLNKLWIVHLCNERKDYPFYACVVDESMISEVPDDYGRKYD